MLGFKVFFSGSPDRNELYTACLERLEKMKSNGLIELCYYPLVVFKEEDNYFPKAIMTDIDNSAIMIALLDKSGRESQWVNQEVGYAMAKEIEILVLADDREQVHGFINMQTKTIQKGTIEDLPDKMEKALMDFWKKHEEEIFEKVLLDEIPDMRKIIEFEESALIYAQLKDDKPVKIVRRFKQDVDGLISDYHREEFGQGFLKMSRLRQIKTLDLCSIYDIEDEILSSKFKDHCKDFEVHVTNLINARIKKVTGQ